VSERYIEIRNWDRFQHKDVWRKSGGTPPWIKAYTALLHDHDWTTLSQSQQGILVNLWLMYASAGRSVSDTEAKRRLCRSDAEARWWRSNLESLSDAGFIEFVSQPIRAPVAPRVEERREEERVNTLSAVSQKTNGLTEAEVVAARERREQSGWVDNLSSYTGCRIVRGEVGVSHTYDPLGTEYPPAGWPHEKPTKQEVVAALRQRDLLSA